jgi:non-ribosomal peptide synthetase-like protein
VAAFDLISIGNGSTVDEGSSLLGYTVENGELVVGPVSIGRRCFVGTRSVLSIHTRMEHRSRLDDLSMLPAGERVPAGETWAGSPARRVHKETVHADPAPARSRLYRSAMGALYAAIALSLPLIELAAFLPGVALLTRFHPSQGPFYLAVPLAGASFIVCLMTEVMACKWLLVGRARAGRYPVDSWFYLRHWVVEQLLALGVDAAGPLHATLYLKPWYRALGARLGRFVELSTANVTTPDLLEVEDGGTVADEASLAAARVEGGWLTLAPIRLGRRAFAGNNAVIPAGTRLGDDSLVGLLTVAPPAGDAAESGATWLGSPPIRLPRRQPSQGFSEQRTFLPSRKLQWARALCEIPRITLPGAGFILVTVATIELGTGRMLACLPAVYMACCAAAIAVVAAVKWIAIGRYQPFERPLWSLFLWRLEFVNALFEFFAAPLALEALEGTPLLPWYLRMLGARIGRQVYIGSTGFLEFDLTEVGDRAVLNKDCILQTHLFEDRILKGSRLRVGAGCEIGAHAVALYNSEMHDGARIGPLSLLMKGEMLPAGTEWEGSPLAAVSARLTGPDADRTPRPVPAPGGAAS